MDGMYINYSYLVKNISDSIINRFDYPLDYGELSNYFLSLTYGDKLVINTVSQGDELYISPSSIEVIDNIIDACMDIYLDNKEELEITLRESNDPEEIEIFKEEVLKWEQLINVLKVMKSSKLSVPQPEKYTFVALPRGKGSTLDDSVYNVSDDIQATLRNMDSLEGLVSASMGTKNMIITRKKGTGLHKAGKHLMYKNVGNNQRILFKQCEDNPNVFFVLVVSCGVHGNDQKDDARENQYDSLTSELERYFDQHRVNGRVVISSQELNRLRNCYEDYKVSLARQIARNKKDTKIQSLERLVSKIKKEASKKKVGEQYG